MAGSLGGVSRASGAGLLPTLGTFVLGAGRAGVVLGLGFFEI